MPFIPFRRLMSAPVRMFFCLGAALLLGTGTSMAEDVWIPDPALRQYLEGNYPNAMHDGYLDSTDPNVQATSQLVLNGLGMHSLEGLRAFANLLTLDVSGNPLGSSNAYPPLSVLSFHADNCGLTGTYSAPPNVKNLTIRNNSVTTLDLSQVHDMQWLDASYNQLTSITPNYPILIEQADLSHNHLTSPGFLIYMTERLDLSYNDLTTFPVPPGGVPVSELDLSHNHITSLGIFSIGTQALTTLDLSWNPLNGGMAEIPPSLTTLTITNTQLSCLPWIPWGLHTLICTGSLFTCLPNMPFALDRTAANFGFTPTVCPTGSACYIAPPRARIRMVLQGPWDERSGLMRDDLRQQGLLPTTEPYSAMGDTYIGNEAPLTVPASRFTVTGPDAIVDWVLVELIQLNTTTVVGRYPALLQRDGDVVATDGDSLLRLNIPRGTYHIAVRHRNHLSAYPPGTVSQLDNGPAANVDFRAVNAMRTYTASANGIRMLVSGDVNGDRSVKYTGANNDRDPILVRIGGTTPTNVVHGQYRGEDVNMDGDIKYTGANNDRDPILLNIGGTTPTAVRTGF